MMTTITQNMFIGFYDYKIFTILIKWYIVNLNNDAVDDAVAVDDAADDDDDDDDDDVNASV